MIEENTVTEGTTNLVINETKAVIATKVGFLNPFDEGVSYADFKEALGKKSIADYCKGKLTEDQITWLENELSILKNE